MTNDLSNNNPKLCEFLLEKITSSPEQQITFAEYMDAVLYHPQYGYYATQQPQIGAAGDFFTSPHLGADFGEMLAEQFVEMWEILGYPNTFTLVEMGAGQGILAGDILNYLSKRYPEFLKTINYIIIEKSPSLKAEQQQQLQRQLNFIASIQWCELSDIPNDSITGCFFSNELVDALPVHQVVIQNSQLQEVYVRACRSQSTPLYPIDVKFTETVGELSTPKLKEYFKQAEIDLLSPIYGDGYRTEVNLAALEWIKTVAEKMHQGFILTIDYGYAAQRYYYPTRRSGTLQCYYQHSHHNDPYIHIGYQDLTAHVDFTALEKQGKLLGLEIVGSTQQALFLMALGLGDRIAAIAQSTNTSISETLRRREALHSLINPMGLGNFIVLIQSKNVTPKPGESIQLKGLQSI
ncbi:MAG: class I SAM-dependent methyltransferase [Microcoleaceae cyanobacterium]